MLRMYEPNKTVCIEIRVGDKVTYDDGRVGVLKKIELKPNGANNPSLITLLTVKLGKSTVTAVTYGRT